ncbi:MAG: alanine racemase, partial [Quisquiliibacterium sp.]
MARPTSALIDLAAMRHNLSLARARAGGSMIWAVVKADAYGHGLDNARRAFDSADGLALIEFDQAARLRELGWGKPILMLEGPFEPGDLEIAVHNRLSLVLHQHTQLDWIARCALPEKLALYLKFNSGMNRLGFDAQGLRNAYERALGLNQVSEVTLMTHFANADLPGGAQASLSRFQQACQGLQAASCLANSAAVLDLPETHGNAVRPGIMLYGASPFSDRQAGALGLRAAMTLRSELIAIQELIAGDEIGYGSTFRADRPIRIGVVACGYA